MSEANAFSRYQQLLYDIPAQRVARITLNRPDRRNAQGRTMTYELNDAFNRAARDPQISVIVLAAADPHFSAGHDLAEDMSVIPESGECNSAWSEFDAPGWEGAWSREKEMYLEMCERWRNLPKPTVAQVQGKVIAGGNMLAWACDLIICSDDAMFRDNTTEMGIPGAEFWLHPWELGVRKAKEWLFTADWITAAEAKERGMVNHVVPRAELQRFTLDLCARIARKPLFALKLAKEACNYAQDAMGRRIGSQHAFALHHVAHAHHMIASGRSIVTDSLPESVRSRSSIADDPQF